MILRGGQPSGFITLGVSDPSCFAAVMCPGLILTIKGILRRDLAKEFLDR